MTKLLCSRHSGSNANIWRANVVSSREMNTGIRGGLASSIKWTTTIFWLSCDVMEPTWLQCAMSTIWAGEDELKAMKMIDCMTLWRKWLLQDSIPFQNRSKKLLNVFIADRTTAKTANARNTHHTWHMLYIESQLLTQTCALNPDNHWRLMTFLKAGIKATYCIMVFFLHLDAMRESRFYSSKSQEAQRQLLEWNGEALSQKATASALSGDCHQQFGLKEWLLMLKCLCASCIFFLPDTAIL